MDETETAEAAAVAADGEIGTNSSGWEPGIYQSSILNFHLSSELKGTFVPFRSDDK